MYVFCVMFVFVFLSVIVVLYSYYGLCGRAIRVLAATALIDANLPTTTPTSSY